jgi:hypothetical protein
MCLLAPKSCHWYWTLTTSSVADSTVVCGLGFGVSVPRGTLWSKNSNCTGLAAVALVGLTCTH